MEPELLEALRRNSGLRLDSEGRFFFHDRPVENERVQTLFHRHLAVTQDGDVTLTVGEQWAYVECEAVAQFVDTIGSSGAGLKIRFRHREDSVVGEPWLGFAPDGRCYRRTRNHFWLRYGDYSDRTCGFKPGRVCPRGNTRRTMGHNKTARAL